MAARVSYRSQIASAQRRVNSLLRTDPALPEALNDLGKAYQTAFPATRDAQLLVKALSAYQQAADIAISRSDLSLRSRFLVNVGVASQSLFECEGSEDYLHQSIRVLYQAKEHISAHFLGALLNNLGISLHHLYNCTFQLDDLSTCIETYREGIALGQNPSVNKTKSNLCNALILRFELAGVDQDLLQASALAEELEAISRASTDEPMRARFLDTCASCWSVNASYQNSTVYRERAVDCSREAVRLGHETGDERVLIYLINLVTARLECESNDYSTLLDESISDLEDIADEFEPTQAEYPKYTFILAKCHLLRFEARGANDDIEKAVNISTQAASFVDEINPLEAALILNCVGNSRMRRYQLHGNEIDIDTAIIAHKNAIGKLGEKSPDMIAISNDLCNSLLMRYEVENSIEDLENTLDTAARILDTDSGSRSDQAFLSVTQGDAFVKVYERTGELDYLNSAISSFETAVEISVEGEKTLSGILSVWGHALQMRYVRSKSATDIENAIRHCFSAVNRAQRSPNLHDYLTNLGNAYLRRCLENTSEDLVSDLDLVKLIQDLQKSVEYLEQARNIMAPSSTSRGMCLVNLGKAYELLFEQLPSVKEYYNNAVAVYQTAIDLKTAAPNLRITAGYRGTLLCVSKDVSRAAQFARLSIALFPMLSSRAMTRLDQQENIAQWAGFASYGAAVLLEAGRSELEALQLLETGRNVINNKFLQTRTDLKQLQELPKLAKKFEALRNRLDNPSSLYGNKLASKGEFSLEAESKRQAARDFEVLLKEIRSNEGLKSFLKPLQQKDFREAVDASGSYIVAINVTSLRSDAIVISQRQISSLPLLQLTHAHLLRQATSYLEILKKDSIFSRSATNTMLRSVLKWLWDCALQPILRYLESDCSSNNLPRVWWMPVGLLSIFPLHAAGGYNNISCSSVLDRAVSLYTPSIQSLIYSRKKTTAISKPVRRGLCVSMPQTPQRPRLPFADLEIQQLSDLLEGSLEVKVLTQTESTKKDVIKALGSTDIVHFCCHGEVDAQNPSESRLLLQDWETEPLTVADIAAQNLKTARFAYLSACHASSIRVVNLLDEGFHLAGAFQMAGFVQTIGTLWQVNDQRAAQVANKVYEYLLGEGKELRLGQLADALHEAVRDLRDATMAVDDAGFQTEAEDQPFTWAPFVCVGL